MKKNDIISNGSKVNTDALNNCYELMGRLNPDHWDVYTDGEILTLKLRTMSTNEMVIQFKGHGNIRISKTNCLGKIIGSETITNPFISHNEFMHAIKEIFGDDVFVPHFDRKMLK